MKRFAIPVLLAAGLLAVADHVNAAILYNYDWQTQTNPVTVVSDNGMYKLNIIATPKSFNQTISQDTQAVNFALGVMPDQIAGTDTFTNKSFNMILLLDNNAPPGSSNSSAPMAFKVDFSLSVSNNQSTATAINLTPLTQGQSVGNLDFNVGVSSFTGQWFTAPSVDNGSTKGGIGLHIDVKEQDAPPTNQTPEPSSMLLAGMGLLGFAGWRKLRGQKA